VRDDSGGSEMAPKEEAPPGGKRGFLGSFGGTVMGGARHTKQLVMATIENNLSILLSRYYGEALDIG
jgi:hypothetical protein